MYIDSHAHLYLDQFDEDINEVIQRAVQSEVGKIMMPNIDSSTTEAMNDLASSYPKICYPMIGLHPCSVKENYKDELRHVEEQLGKRKYYGIGETGIDLYWDTTFKEQQIESFVQQISWSIQYKLPIVIHSRDSLDLTIELIEKHHHENLKGVFHCFNGTVSQAKRIQGVGFMMGMGGVITFKKAQLEEVISSISMDHMMLETDAPFLAPTPNRGKRNESSFIPLVAAKIAEVKNISLEEVQSITTANAKRLFSV